MTEEMNEKKEEKKCSCICCSQGFKDFLKITLGSFVGVFLALSLFAALHKPPVMHCPFGKMMPPPPISNCHNYNRGFNDFQKFKPEQKGFDKRIPVKVEIEK